MFDYVIPECPLPDGNAAQVPEWQTKAFDVPYMDHYRITPEGRLMEEVYRVEDRSEFARTGQGDQFVGCMTRVREGWRVIEFDGVLNFYGTVGTAWARDGEWIEYDATFAKGQLVSIVRVREEPPALTPEKAAVSIPHRASE